MALEHESDSPIARAVRAAGSQSAFGRLVDKRQSTVREWLKAGQMPADDQMVIKVETAIGISRHDLRPDIYPREATPAHPRPRDLEPAR